MLSRNIATLLFVALSFSGSAVLRAETGLAPGAEVPELKVAAVAGVVSGEERNFAEDRKEKPTIYVFVQQETFGRPTGRFLSVLDQELAKDRGDVQVIAVWLADDVEKAKEYLPRAQQSLRLSQTVWSVFPGEKTGPAGWNIDVADHVTAVVAEGNKATKSFAYKSVNDTVVPEVLKALPEKK